MMRALALAILLAATPAIAQVGMPWPGPGGAAAGGGGGATSQVLAGTTAAAISNAGNRFFPLGYTGQAASATDISTVVFPAGGTVSLLKAKAVTALTGTQQWTITINKNGSATTLTCVLTLAANPCADGAHSFSVVAGDYVDIQSTPANTPTNSILTASVVFTPTNANDTVLGARFAGLSTAAAQDVTMWTDRTTAISISTLPEPGTVDDLFVVSTAPGGVASYAFSGFKNGAAAGSPGNLTTTVTGAATSGNDTTNVISVVDGDVIQFHSVPSGTPATATVAYGARFRPTTSGNFTFWSSVGAADSATVTTFIPIGGQTNTQITAETTAQAIVNSMTVTKMEVTLPSAPGAGTSKAFTLRDNAADTALTCTIANTATTCSATGTVTVNDNDLLDISDVPTGSPATPASQRIALSAHR